MDARTASDHAYGSVPSLDNGEGDAPPPRRCVAAVSLGLACISACVPLANKAVLRHGAEKAALTMTACQRFSVAVICGLIHAVIAVKTGAAAPVGGPSQGKKYRPARCGLGPNSAPRTWARVGVRKMHALLAATDIVWTALFARLVNGERCATSRAGSPSWLLRAPAS